MSDPNKEYEAILPLLNRVHRRIKDASVTHEHRAALMTMIAANFMGHAGAMMAALSDVKAGRPQQHDVPGWTEAVAKEVVAILRRGGVAVN